MPVRLLEPVEKEALALAEIAKSSIEIRDEACGKCVKHFGEIHPEGKSLLLWLLDLICMIARTSVADMSCLFIIVLIFQPLLISFIM